MMQKESNQKVVSSLFITSKQHTMMIESSELTAGVGHPSAMAASPTLVHCRISK